MSQEKDKSNMVRVRNEDALVQQSAPAPVAATRSYVDKQIDRVLDALLDAVVKYFASREDVAAIEDRVAALEAAADKPRVRVPAGSAVRP